MSDRSGLTAPKHPWYLLALIGALSTFGPLALDLFLPGLPALSAELRADPATAQLSVSLCLVGLALGQLLAGPISDRVGRRLPLLVGVLVFTVSAYGCAFAPTIEVLLGLRLLSGLGGGAGAVIARAMVRDLYQGKAALQAFTLVTMVGGVAPVMAPLLGSGLLTFTDWRGVFVALGLIGTVLVGAALLIGETRPRTVDGHTGPPMVKTMGRLLRDPTFIRPALTLGLTSCPLFTYISMGSFVLQDDPYRLSEQAYGLVFALNACGMVLSGQLNRRLGVSLGPRTMLGVGIAAIAAGSATLVPVMLLGGPLWLVLALLFVAVSSGGLTMPNVVFLAMDRHGGATGGSASALLGLTQFLLAAIIPPAVSAISVSGPAMALTMLVCALGALAVYTTIPRPTS